MKNILKEHYNTKFNVDRISTSLFTNIDVVSVALVVIKDKMIEDIRFISINEGSKNAGILNPLEYIKDDGRKYLVLVNHPRGVLNPSKENVSLYRGLKKLTSNVDVIQVCRDRCVYVSIEAVFDLLL